MAVAGVSRAERLQQIRVAKMVTSSLNPKRAVEVADDLKGTFNEVTIDGSRSTPIVYGKEHNRLKVDFGFNCSHERKLRITDVRAIINGGYLSSGDPHSSRPYAEIVFCQRCEFVFTQLSPHTEEA